MTALGTRADFYVGRGRDAEWVGSIAWDGYPSGIDNAVLAATTEEGFRSALQSFAESRSDFTAPHQGWPWPWEDSRLTDYAYAYDDGAVFGSGGKSWWPALSEPEDDDDGEEAVFPDMSKIENVTFGPRSGLIVVANKET
jgi:hypothetical protein